jgi:hypothetical protein
MSFPPPLSLHHYFVVAARMRHHFESNLVAVEEHRVAALQDPDLAAFELFSGLRGNFITIGTRACTSLCNASGI